jgi:hypothetical protein
MIITVFKIFFLFIAVLFGLSIVIRSIYKNDISNGSVLYAAIGIVGFVVLHFDLL